MATKNNLPINQIGASNPTIYSRVRSTIEAAFYRNNVRKITSLAEAYELAKNCPGTTVTDLPIVNAKELGLPEDAKVLLFNDGKITGRQAALRRLVNDKTRNSYGDLVREVVFRGNRKNWYLIISLILLKELIYVVFECCSKPVWRLLSEYCIQQRVCKQLVHFSGRMIDLIGK